MGFIQKIIDFILGLFGMKKSPEALSPGQGGAYTDAQRQQIRNNGFVRRMPNARKRANHNDDRNENSHGRCEAHA